MPYRKINSKCIKYLNVKPDTVKVLEENKGRTLFDISCNKFFLDPSLRVIKIKLTNGKLKAFRLDRKS